MTEIPPDEVSTQLMNQFLEKCDVAIFVYDSSDEFSWMQVLDIYWKVSRLAENNGFNLQYLFVAAKSDLEQKKFIQEDSSRVCNHMNLRPPMFVNHKLRGRTVFQIILLAAQRPDRNILSRKAKWINFVLYSFSVGVTMLGGLAAIHLRKNKNMKERRQNQKLSHT
uniref:Mitochondrial Rho GTPase 1 n=1 Tax=Anthurium amnicola TaxID=1678845 RepID=A0A1D1ZMI7_9ARAE